MKNNFKCSFLFTLLVIGIGMGCTKPETNTDLRVQGGSISKIEIEELVECNPIPNKIVICDNGLHTYKISYTVTNTTPGSGSISFNKPQVNDKKGNIVNDNACQPAANQVIELGHSGETIELVDTLCFTSDYTFQSPNDSILFSILVVGQAAPITQTLVTSLPGSSN